MSLGLEQLFLLQELEAPPPALAARVWGVLGAAVGHRAPHKMDTGGSHMPKKSPTLQQPGEEHSGT